MVSPAIRALADQLLAKRDTTGQPVEMLWATVTAVVSGPPKTVTIQPFGSDTSIPGVRYAESYTPTNGDVVYGRIVGTDYLVEGTLA